MSEDEEDEVAYVERNDKTATGKPTPSTVSRA
jgi:hypothetical protein